MVRHIFFLIFIIFFTRTFSQDIFEHIYDKGRLVLIKDSMVVFGMITFIRPEIDGDYHIRLRMSSDCDNLLCRKNFTYQDSSLILEIVCGKGSIFTICNGYKNLIPLPKIGTFVMVMGAYVFDKRHKWNEIHPVYSIKKLPTF